GDEAAGRQLQRPDGLERMGGKRLFKAIQIERFGKAKQGQVAEEHGEWLPWSMWGVRMCARCLRRRGGGPRMRVGTSVEGASGRVAGVRRDAWFVGQPVAGAGRGFGDGRDGAHGACILPAPFADSV